MIFFVLRNDLQVQHLLLGQFRLVSAHRSRNPATAYTRLGTFYGYMICLTQHRSINFSPYVVEKTLPCEIPLSPLLQFPPQ